MVSGKCKQQQQPPVLLEPASKHSRRSSSRKKKQLKPLHESGNNDDGPTGSCLLPQSSPIPAISNGLTSGDEIVSGKTRVELVRCQEPGRTDLGLILSGGADKDDRLHVISVQPGSTAHRTDRILIGDYITAINGVSTIRLKQSEIMTLINNSRNSLVFELHYRLCPSGE